VKLKVNKIYKIVNEDPWEQGIYYIKITSSGKIQDYELYYPAVILSGGIEGMTVYIYPSDWPYLEEVSSLEIELL
jgi:hypothetical protein